MKWNSPGGEARTPAQLTWGVVLVLEGILPTPAREAATAGSMLGKPGATSRPRHLPPVASPGRAARNASRSPAWGTRAGRGLRADRGLSCRK